MKFHEKATPFRRQLPHVFTDADESEVLDREVKRHNEANSGKGLKFLRSLLSNVVALPGWEAAKPVLTALNSETPGSAVTIARTLLSQTYGSPDEHFVNVQVAAFVKKYPFSGDVDLRRQNALAKFLRGERRNRHMNALLRRRRIPEHGVPNDHLGCLGRDPTPWVAHARNYIRRVIGSTPPFQKALLEARWGPGAVVGVNGQFTHFGRKLTCEKWTVTPAAVPYVIHAAKRFPMFWNLLGLTRSGQPGSGEIICVDPDEFESRMLARMEIVQYNKIAFVPKDADCDRTIASEPLLNQWLQLAMDDELKVRLRRVGIDLRFQHPNQEMARQGSILSALNPYCTADLKNASGSVFTELVRELLPPAWFGILNALRSPSWELDGATQKYHGFVSMGNGYCFPLETLIFASICSAAHAYTGTPEDFRVYGDDIVVRQNESGVVQEYLRYFGFELNPEKSFFFGPFRESCGADWYNGEPVRPVYLDDTLDTFEQRIRAHNALTRLKNPWAGPLAHACRKWFPVFISKFCCPFAGETDEALNNCFATVDQPWIMQNKTLQCPSWYGLRFRSVKDREFGQHGEYHHAYRYAALLGANSKAPFAMRRETRMSVARFSHGGGRSEDLPHEAHRRETAVRLPWYRQFDFVGPLRPINLKTSH